jgi:hypothetical protein
LRYAVTTGLLSMNRSATGTWKLPVGGRRKSCDQTFACVSLIRADSWIIAPRYSAPVNASIIRGMYSRSTLSHGSPITSRYGNQYWMMFQKRNSASTRYPASGVDCPVYRASAAKSGFPTEGTNCT